MNKRIALLFVLLALLPVLAVIVMVGCDTAEGLQGLAISPSSVEVSMISNTVELTVVGDTNNVMALPIRWSVMYPSLGTIVMQSGFRALYRRTAENGDNIVTALDQYGNEGFATIRQVAGGSTLSLSASRADTNTWVVTIETRTSAPYEWWVHDPTLGSISSSGNGVSAVYTAENTATENAVFVRDGKGQIGSVRIP